MTPVAPKTRLSLANADLTSYCERSTSPEPTLCQAIRERARQHPQGHWTTGPLVGTLLQIMGSVSRARRVLDIGTFFGYSAVYLARANSDVQVTSLEIDPAQANEARALLATSPLARRIRIEVAEVGQWLRAHPELTFDIIFFDSSRRELMEIYEPLLRAVAFGGVLVMDNACVRGGALAPVRNKDFATAEFNRRIQAERAFLTTVLPVRDGILLAHRLPESPTSV